MSSKGSLVANFQHGRNPRLRAHGLAARRCELRKYVCARDRAVYRAACSTRRRLRGQQVLDVACGPGRLAAAAAAMARPCTDWTSPQPWSALRAKTPAEITFTEGDAERMPYSDGMFHAVVSSFGMHHVPNLKRHLRDEARASRQCVGGLYRMGDAGGQHRLVAGVRRGRSPRRPVRHEFPPPGALNTVDPCRADPRRRGLCRDVRRGPARGMGPS